MTTLKTPYSFEYFNVDFNRISVEALFKKYEAIGFIYPDKKALLQPHFEEIKTNWQMLLQSKKDLLWMLTTKPASDHFASISVFKHVNRGLLAQHLVSDGNPFQSLKIMLSAQFRAEHNYSNDEVNSSQNWFRPNNRYAFRIFASMQKKLGDEKSSLIRFEYLTQPLSAIQQPETDQFKTVKINGIDPQLIQFVDQHYGTVFTQAEELDQEDIELKILNKQYQEQGLKRKRSVFKIVDQKTQKIVAVAVGNRAPLGLNFSFIENRAYFITHRDLSEFELSTVSKMMSQALKELYHDIPLQAIPIATDQRTALMLQAHGAKHLRTYMQSIWMRSGFAEWYQHIDSFLKRIEERNLCINA